MSVAAVPRNPWAVVNALLTAGVNALSGHGAPVSGNDWDAAGYQIAGKGSIYMNLDTGVMYVNDGDMNNVYWSPLNLVNFPNLLSWQTDFRDGVGLAVSGTETTYTIPGSGVRIFGQGLAETDSGVTVAIGEGGPVASCITTDEDEHVIALGAGITTSVPYQPDTHGTIAVEALVAMSSAITLRRFFIGFIGTAADALDPPVTGTTATITLVQDDLAGLFYDAELTDADRLYAPHNKSDEAATIACSACDTEVDFPAAGTYTKLRVEIDAEGTMRCYKDGVLVFTQEEAVDVDEELAPVVLCASESAATKTMLVKYFRTWGSR